MAEPAKITQTDQIRIEEHFMEPVKVKRGDFVVAGTGATKEVRCSLRIVEPVSKPDIRQAFKASWKRNEEAYRYLGR